MKYGNDDQAGQSDLEESRRRMQRRMQLSLMSKRQLIIMYRRMQRARGGVTVFGGPVTKHDYVDAIECDERMARLQAAHLAEFGEGHEQCPSVNFTFRCDAVRDADQ